MPMRSQEDLDGNRMTTRESGLPWAVSGGCDDGHGVDDGISGRGVTGCARVLSPEAVLSPTRP